MEPGYRVISGIAIRLSRFGFYAPDARVILPVKNIRLWSSLKVDTHRERLRIAPIVKQDGNEYLHLYEIFFVPSPGRESDDQIIHGVPELSGHWSWAV